MDPRAKTADLLYISDVGTNDVYVYTYPQLRLSGTLTGFSTPYGECADKRGDVWITNYGSSEIVEYAHGGTSPINTLNDPGQNPFACSVNIRNGALAVTNLTSTSGGSGSLSIYKKAAGSPKNYVDPNFHQMYFLSYDNKGNIFVDGENASSDFLYAELTKGSSTFTDITLTGSGFSGIRGPGGVQFNGKYIAVGDLGGNVIYQTSGSMVTGSTTLGDQTGGVLQFSIQGNRVISPDRNLQDFDVYKYPAGGFALKIISGFSTPFSAVVSK
jgi:hypothetical protein